MKKSRPVHEKNVTDSTRTNFRNIIQTYVWETMKFVRNRRFIEQHYLVELIYKEMGYTTNTSVDVFKRCRYYDYVVKLITTELSGLRHRTEKNITKACNGKWW